MKASKGAAVVDGMPPGSGARHQFAGMGEGNHYSGTLPGNGEYTIRIYLKGNAEDSGKPVTLALKVGISTGENISSGSGSEASEAGMAEKACPAAVAKAVGQSSNRPQIGEVFSSEAGITARVQVPDATAP